MDRPTVVIGGGIVGTAIAYALQIAKQPTILVERDVELQGASAFSFGSLTAFDEPQRDVYLLKTQGMVGWRSWAREFGDDLGVRFPGELRWSESKEDGRHLTTLVERAASRGYPVRSVTADGIAECEPAAHPGNVTAAAFAPYDGQADPVVAIGVLGEAFTDAHGQRITGRATIVPSDDGLLVRAGDESLLAGTVVLATGAETSALLGRLGWEVPMEPSPGLLALTGPVPPALNGTVYVSREGDRVVHLRQREDGRVVVGERAQDEVARHPTLAHASSLLRRAAASFPFLGDAEIERFTVEWRPMPRDGMPIVGRMPGLPSLYVAVGHSGVTIAPALARFVVEELVEGTESERLVPFRPGRFSASEAEAVRSVEAAFAAGPEIFLG
jgi:glycine/D-amino acid oxidase-like deaminating enzyme